MLTHFLRYPSPLVLAARGPLVDVVFAAHPDIGPTPGHSQAEKVTMLIDTGATRTLVDDRVAKTLGLTPGRYDPITGVDGITELRPVYRMKMSLELLDHKLRGYNLNFAQDIVGMKPVGHNWHGFGLIGRDFLAHVRLVYDGPEGCVTITERQMGAAPEYQQADAQDRRDRKLARKERAKAQRRNRGR